jgi:V8-like Glu-specific endopeptidase
MDNRKDLYEVSNNLHRTLANSTAGMISMSDFARGAGPKVLDLINTTSLERAQNICASEKFSQQSVAPNCSGFLVAPDTIVTAGHCYKSFDTPKNVCKNFAWVFDYSMKSAQDDPTRNIPLSNIYLCKKVFTAVLTSTMDYAIIKLDRPVVGRAPLKLRTTGKISPNSSLVVIGHPTGLPMKVSAGAKVTRNTEPTTFSTTLDTFHGNSGSAVFNARTGLVEGILIQGKSDYVPSRKDDHRSCLVVNKCDENGENCEAGMDFGPVQWGEVVLRIEKIASKIAASATIE